MKADVFNRLLKQLKGSEQAFRQIYEYYLPRIKYHVASKYGSRVDFEDVAHDLFTKLIRMESPPEVQSPTAWIYRICDNIVLDKLRRTRGEVELNESISAAPITGSLTEAEVDSNADFFKILSHLDNESSQLVRLVVWDGYNLKEAAQILKIGYGAARQRYSRALKKLKDYL